jgi:hypothetical protein
MPTTVLQNTETTRTTSTKECHQGGSEFRKEKNFTRHVQVPNYFLKCNYDTRCAERPDTRSHDDPQARKRRAENSKVSEWRRNEKGLGGVPGSAHNDMRSGRREQQPQSKLQNPKQSHDIKPCNAMRRDERAPCKAKKLHVIGREREREREGESASAHLTA